MKYSKVSDFASRKAKKTAERRIAAKGWELQEFNSESDPIGIYLYDVDSHYVKMITPAKGSMKELEEKVLAFSDDQFQEICDSLGTEINRNRKKPSKSGQSMIDALLLPYMIRTRTYEMVKSVSEGGEFCFIVICYYAKDKKGHILRPAAVPNQEMLTPDELSDFVLRTLQTDLENHPERF